MPTSDTVINQRVVSNGGLNTLNNYLTLSMSQPGAAVRLQNFESSKAGGYATIKGYTELDEDFAEVGVGTHEGAILGIWIFYNSFTQEEEIIAARKQTGVDEYDFFLYALGVGWTAFATGFTHATEALTGFPIVRRIRAETFNHGDSNKIIFVDGVNPATVYDGIDWYQITSAAAGGILTPGGDQALDAPAYVAQFKNHIFISGDITFPNIVAHSAPNDVFTWTVAAGAGQLPVGIEVNQIRPFRDELFVFSDSAIRRIVINGADFTVQDVTSKLGCVASDSVTEIAGGLIFMSHDGIRPIAGTVKINDVELGLITQSIQDTIDSIFINQDMADLNAVVIKQKTQFRYFLSSSVTERTLAQGLIGCLRQSGDSTQWEYAELKGFSANCAVSGQIDRREIVLHGGYDGIVYRQENGNSLAGDAIEAIYATPFLDMGDTTLRKNMHEIDVFIKSEGTFQIDVGVRFDWNSPNAINPQNYTSVVGGASVYDDLSVTYDDPSLFYGGTATSVYKQPIEGSGYSVQYIFSSQSTNPGYTIHGFVHQFIVEGRD